MLSKLREDHILVEQVKLVMRNAPAGFVGSWATALLVYIALRDQAGVLIWFITYSTVCAGGLLYVFIRAAISDTVFQNDRLFLLTITSLGGTLWGSLSWVAFDSTSVAASTLILGTNAGIIGAALAMMSPYFPCYKIFLITAVCPLSLKLLMQEKTIFISIGLACLVYLAVMYYFAHFSQMSTLEAIKLRFQNADLLEQLKNESASATAARDQALAANSAKSKFLAAASHDLRQPIHAMNLFLEAVVRSGLLPHQQEIVRNAQLASTITRDMLNTLLDFSKIEAGVLKATPLSFYMQPLLSQLENEFSILSAQKELIYRSRETKLAVSADPGLVMQVLRNLISNAVRYTEKGGVVVGCRARNGGQQNGMSRSVVIEVWDTGIGIPAEQSSNIFNEFYQLDNPKRDHHKGLGLGLAIVKGIAKSMGTEVTLASAPGRGSVFRFSLPLAQDVFIDDLNGAAGWIPEFNGQRVLVIDDDKMVLEGMRILLTSWNCSVSVAETIEEALLQVAEKLPELVISDYQLRDGMTGHDVIALLREETAVNLPCIIITGDISPMRLRETMAMGAILMHKPVSTDELSAAIARLLTQT